MAEQRNEGFKMSRYRLFSRERIVRLSWLVAERRARCFNFVFTTWRKRRGGRTGRLELQAAWHANLQTDFN